jgi:hypothetical protein
MAQFTDAFIAVSNGPLPVLWREDGAIRETTVYAITPVDTFGARRMHAIIGQMNDPYPCFP